MPLLGFLDRSCELGPCDRRDVRLGVLSFKYFCVFFFIPQGVNLTGFGRHNKDINARGRELKKKL